jgi:MFS family permease
MPATKPSARVGLSALFASTYLELVGVFMLLPLNLLRLKDAGLDTATAGLFAATGYAGIFLFTPFASTITARLGRKNALWVSALICIATGLVFALSPWIATWFVAQAIAGMAGGLRWVLAEALVAEFSPPGKRGVYVGIFETLVGMTFIVSPILLAWIGPQSPVALWVALAALVAGAALTAYIPSLPPAHDHAEAPLGLHGIWRALSAYPVIMFAGFMGGFFEAGLTAILPLMGLSMGWSPTMATLLVAASGIGSAVLMLPAGFMADFLSKPNRQGVPRAFWGSPAHTRLQLMRLAALFTGLGTLTLPLTTSIPELAWFVALTWGGAGGVLYTLAMIDIGNRETGIRLVSGTAVLVLVYTAGGMVAPAIGAAALQISPSVGFPLVLCSVAALGLILLARARAGDTSARST